MYSWYLAPARLEVWVRAVGLPWETRPWCDYWGGRSVPGPKGTERLLRFLLAVSPHGHKGGHPPQRVGSNNLAIIRACRPLRPAGALRSRDTSRTRRAVFPLAGFCLWRSRETSLFPARPSRSAGGGTRALHSTARVEGGRPPLGDYNVITRRRLFESPMGALLSPSRF